MHTFYQQEDAIRFIERHFPVTQHHHAASADIKRNKEFFVLKQFIRTGDPLVRYPLAFEHCGTETGFPDFILTCGNVPYLVEVSEITNRESQLVFQHKQDLRMEMTGSVDLTPIVKSVVERKNSKLAKYKASTNIEHSILLLDHNQWPPFSYGLPGDDLRVEDIRSFFDHTFLFVPVYGASRNYIKI